jgi:hypothetical protein
MFNQKQSKMKDEMVNAETTANDAKERKLENAYLIPQEDGDQFLRILGEIPLKYGQLVGPMIDKLQKSLRGTVTVKVNE